MDLMIATLAKLEQVLQAKKLPRATANWHSLYVTIAPSRKGVSTQAHDPLHVFVFTKHASEVSWFFEHLVSAFCGDCKEKQPKEPFARRLALAANTCKRRVRSPGARRLCTAVWHEAHAVYDEIGKGDVRYPPPDVTDLMDQDIEDALASGFIGPDATQRFASRMRRESK